MENRPFPIPTGEAFLVKTPYLDEVGKRLYREQQQRELQQRADSKALDDEFTKNVAGVRDADVTSVVQKYGDYKNLWKQLNKKGAVITPEQQMELLRKKADVLGHIAKSKQEKEVEDLAAKDLTKNPNNFEPNAHSFLIERRKLPVDQMQVTVPNPKTGKTFNFDMTDIYGNILYKGSNTDFQPAFKKSQGILQQRGESIIEKSPDGLTTTTTTYKAFNPPAQQYATLNESRKGSNWEKDFLIKHDYNDDEANEIVNQYEQLKETPAFKTAYKDVPDIPSSAFTSKLGRAMALTVMKNAVENPPVEIKGKPVQDVGAVLKNKQGFQVFMEGLKQKNRKELIGVREEAKAKGEAANDLWIDAYLDKIKTEAQQGQERTYKFTDGKVLDGYTVPLDPVLSKAIGFDDKNKGVLMLTKEGKYVPIFYKTDENYNPIQGKDGKYAVDNSRTNILSQDAIKLALGGKAGVKQLNKEMSPKGKGKPKTVVQNGHTYYLNTTTGEYE